MARKYTEETLIEGPRKNRILKTEVRLEYHPDEEETPWVTICDEHCTCVGHTSKKTARSFLAVPWEWCEACYAAVESKGINV